MDRASGRGSIPLLTLISYICTLSNLLPRCIMGTVIKQQQGKGDFIMSKSDFYAKFAQAMETKNRNYARSLLVNSAEPTWVTDEMVLQYIKAFLGHSVELAYDLTLRVVKRKMLYVFEDSFRAVRDEIELI